MRGLKRQMQKSFIGDEGFWFGKKREKSASECSRHDLILTSIHFLSIIPSLSCKFPNLAPFFAVKTFDVVLSVKKRYKIQNLTSR